MKRVGKHSAHARRRGVALLYAVFGAFVAASMVSVMLTMASVTRRGAGLKQAKMQAMYLAEGAIEAAKKDVQEAIANWQEPPTEGQVTIGNQLVTYTITPTGLSGIVTEDTGIQTLTTGYELIATATLDRAQHQAHRIINAQATPIFQFAVFYTNDLEIQPGPNMTLGGRVHSNRNMFLGSDNTLTMNTNYVRSVGRIFRRRKDNTNSSGTVKIRKWVENPYDTSVPTEYVDMLSRSQMSSMGATSASGYDSSYSSGYDANGDGDFIDTGELLPFAAGALEYWSEASSEINDGNTVLTGQHGVTEAVSPNIGSIKMYEPSDVGDYNFDSATGRYVLATTPGTGSFSRGFYHDHADVSIIVNADGTDWEAYSPTGFDLKPALEFAHAVSLSDIYDARQSDDAQSVPIVKVDMNALNRSGVFPANGLLYASHYDMGEGIDAKGIQLVNASELNASLTVVTEGSAYIQGDFNTQNKKGAAVIGDAVNLLSNAWDGSKTQGTLPTADHTTYNVAIITGNHETAGSHYNGGLENLPRFHERWSGKNCVILGSFVNTWSSEYATGQWSYGGDRYNAPNRRWAYDPMFNDVANLPPFTPMAVSAEDIVSW